MLCTIEVVELLSLDVFKSYLEVVLKGMGVTVGLVEVDYGCTW